MRKWQRPKERDYYGAPRSAVEIGRTIQKKSGAIRVDASLNDRTLNRINSNPNIRCVGVCAGHEYPTEPYGSKPKAQVAFVRVRGSPQNPKIPSGMRVRKVNDVTILERTKPGKAPKSWWEKATKIVEGL